MHGRVLTEPGQITGYGQFKVFSLAHAHVVFGDDFSGYAQSALRAVYADRRNKPRGDIFSSGPDVWMQTFERGKITHSAFHGATVTID